MKLCVIGNSHVASLKGGFDDLNTKGLSLDLTYFAARGPRIRELGIQSAPGGDVVLAPPKNSELEAAFEYTSGGKKIINFKDYDVCFLYGLFHVPRHDKSLSSEVVSRLRQELVGRSVISKIMPLIEQCTPKIPIFVGHVPLPNADEDEAFLNIIDAVSFDEQVSVISELLGLPDNQVIRQPAHTRDGEIRTKEVFGKNSQTLDLGDFRSGKVHGVKDKNHMNRAFGAEIAKCLLSKLG